MTNKIGGNPGGSGGSGIVIIGEPDSDEDIAVMREWVENRIVKRHFRRVREGSLMEDFLATVSAVVLFILVIFGLVHIGVTLDKWECEKDLPRNVECTWQAPERAGE